MGRRNSAKTGGSFGSNRKISKKEESPAVEIEEESDNNSDGYIPLDKGDNAKDSDEDDDAVLDLAIGDSEEDEEEDEENDSDDDDDNELMQLVDNLPTELRRKVLDTSAADDDDDDFHDDDEPLKSSEGWGRKKKTFYSGDTADLEIGQEMEDAEDEEAAALELQKEKLARLDEDDYFDDVQQDSDDDDDINDEETYGKMLKSSAKKTKKKKGKKSLSNEGFDEENEKIVGDLGLIALGENGNMDEVQVERLEKDYSHLTKKQRKELVEQNAPELVGIAQDLKEITQQLQQRINPIREFSEQYKELLKENEELQDEVLDYLHMKQQLLLCYCTNAVFYLYMKSLGKSVKNHPVMKQLLQLRFLMEKLRPIDGKLQPQIDRLIQLSTLSEKDLQLQVRGSLLKPNPAALLGKGLNGNSSEGEEGSEVFSQGEEETKASDKIYRAPKLAAVPYMEQEKAAEKKEKKALKMKKKLRSSELMETLREEFGTAPEVAGSSGLETTGAGELKRLRDEAKEREQFEEDRFVRTTLSRKEKKNIKSRTAAASRLDNFTDIGDFADFDELDLINSKKSKSTDNQMDTDGLSSKDILSSKALQRAVSALANTQDDDYDDDDDFDQHDHPTHDDDEKGASRKRRRAPMIGADQNDDDEGENPYDNLVENFASKKKDFLQRKKEHYTAEPRYGGVDEEVEGAVDSDGEAKRAASYEMIKNRGLTPHRKKSNRNPRVKKREKYHKALVARKGQVREVKTGMAGSYGGELTGIKANLSRSRKMDF